MVVLDGTIVNIALPSAQRDLGFSDNTRQWVVTAYALAFGGLLLFGGRIADLWGRKRAFTVGVIGFAAASAIGGAALNTGMLLGARALQGLFGALLAPSALSLLSIMFTEARDRAKAFGVYGAISGGGAAIGLIIGGLLTEYLSWRWTMYVNVLFAVIAALGAYLVIQEPAAHRSSTRLDIPGVVLASGGLVALVYGFSTAETDGWGATVTVSMFITCAVLLTAFVVVQSRVRAPLLPLRVVWDRNRGGAYLSLATAIIGMFGLFLFLTFYLQVVLGFSPVTAGVAFLPMVAGMMIGATQIGARLAPLVAPRLLMTPGFALAAAGLALLTQISVAGNYSTVVLPGMFLMGIGLGTAFMPAMSLATLGVQPRDAGVASAMVNTCQQVGGAIGTALLNTIATNATKTYAIAHKGQITSPRAAGSVKLHAMVHGYSFAISWAAGILLLSAVIAGLLIAARPIAGSSGGSSENDTVPTFAH
jgi:EmrB/QacA subfamily drug resistance transporter